MPRGRARRRRRARRARGSRPATAPQCARALRRAPTAGHLLGARGARPSSRLVMFAQAISSTRTTRPEPGRSTDEAGRQPAAGRTARPGCSSRSSMRGSVIDLCANGEHVALRLGERHARLQASDRIQPVRARGDFLFGERVEPPEARRLVERTGAMPIERARRQDADPRCGSLSSSRSRSRMLRSPPKSCCHRRGSDDHADGAGWSSSGRNVRPISGWMPNTAKWSHDT